METIGKPPQPEAYEPFCIQASAQSCREALQPFLNRGFIGARPARLPAAQTLNPKPFFASGLGKSAGQSAPHPFFEQDCKPFFAQGLQCTKP